ncbi:MAG: hypothetical protein ACJ8F3_21700 [Xanthobacteraceae bacterium]
MIKAMLGMLAAAVVIVTAASFATVSAEPKAPPPASCTTLKEEMGCKDRTDCQWVAATVDSKTGKEKRKAYCRRVPATKKK